MFLILAIVVCLAFWPCFSSGFLNWDDPDHLLYNSFLPFHHFNDIRILFSAPNSVDETNLLFLPLTILSFGIERFFWGLNPFVFHLNNILLHILSSILVFALGYRMGLSRKGALIAALVFALHPMKVESVAWVTERKDVLSGVFYLGALVLYWDYIKSAQGMKYIFALLCGIASVLAKPMALSLPIILFLFDWVARRRPTMNSLLDKLPFMIAIWPIAAITTMLHTRPFLWNPVKTVLLGAYSSTFYVIKFFLPFDLSAIYLIPKPITLQQPQYAAAILTLTVVLLGFYLFRHKRWVVFAFLFYVLTMFFLWRIDSYERIIVSERFMYIPSVGFSFLIGAGWDKLFFKKPSGQRRGWIWASLLSSFLAGMTFSQCFFWQDSLVFWNEVLRKNPNYFKAFYNRADCLLNDHTIAKRYFLDNKTRYLMAREDLYQAIRISKDDPDAWNNLGYVFRRLGHNKEADAAFIKARYLRIIK